MCIYDAIKRQAVPATGKCGLQLNSYDKLQAVRRAIQGKLLRRGSENTKTANTRASSVSTYTNVRLKCQPNTAMNV